MHTTLKSDANFRLRFNADSGLGYCRSSWPVFSPARKQVIVITADQYTFATNIFPLDPALYQITSKHCWSTHTAWKTAAKKPLQNWPGRSIWMYWIFYIQIRLWSLNIFHHDALMEHVTQSRYLLRVNYNQREEIVLSSHSFLVLFERGWTPIRTGLDTMTWSRSAFKTALNWVLC